VTQQVARELITIAQKKGDKEMEKSFWNTYYCLNNIVVSDHKIYGSYCKNRICATCNSIRKAEIINKYLPVIETWAEPQLVTLTAKSCYAKSLNTRVKAMKRAFKIILTKCNKKHQRGKGPKLIGIKSLECNFNPEKRTYNPHYHIIVPNWEIAILLKREWMKLWTKRFTNGWAQDIRPVKNNLEGLIEVVKYGSKIFTEPDPDKNNRKKVTRYVYISALYNILFAMRNIRLFDRFGFNLPRVNPSDLISPSILNEYEEMSYDSDIRDWVNEETGETLSGCTPSANLLHLLTRQINTELQ
jgi:hypothetical protein